MQLSKNERIAMCMHVCSSEGKFRLVIFDIRLVIVFFDQNIQVILYILSYISAVILTIYADIYIR